MDIRALEALGLPPGFTEGLMQLHDNRSLNRLSLPDFLALWKLRECALERADGELVRYGDFVNMQATLADIGGTVGSVSSFDPEELLQLTTLTPGEDSSGILQSTMPQLEELAKELKDDSSAPPASLYNVVAFQYYTLGVSYIPELSKAKDPAEMADVEISVADLHDKWYQTAAAHFNMGIAIAKLHPDVYYAMGEFDEPSVGNGVARDERRESGWPFKREFHMSRCRIWSGLCRPDLAYLLSGE